MTTNGWLQVVFFLAVVLAMALGLAFHTGHGVHDKLGAVSTDTVQGQVQTFSQVVVSFFPVNVVQNFSSNDIIPIILIAVTLSVAFLALAEKEPEKVRPFVSRRLAKDQNQFDVVPRNAGGDRLPIIDP